MLSYFRDRRGPVFLVGSFLLVLVIFAFVVFYIPDFLGPAGGASLEDEVARVEGVSISAQVFLERYRLQEQLYRTQLGAQYPPTRVRQLGLDVLRLPGLVGVTLLLAEAKRQGLA